MTVYSIENKKVWVTGHSGMLGAAICRYLANRSCEILTISHAELDLLSQQATDDWVKAHQPDVVIHCAAKVGGIDANKNYPVDFLNENLLMGMNVINASAKYGVQKLINFGSSCFYPKSAAQPITEESLLTDSLEPTNEAYAVAKIALAKLCRFYYQQHQKDFITIVPTNLYGPGDNFDPEHGHVVASLINKFSAAKINNNPVVELWGTGKPLREFMYVDDAAQGVLFLTEHYSSHEHINLSGGETVSIKELAAKIQQGFQYQGELVFDESRPDGMMKKSLDNALIKSMGWEPKISLEAGLRNTIAYFQSMLATHEV